MSSYATFADIPVGTTIRYYDSFTYNQHEFEPRFTYGIVVDSFVSKSSMVHVLILNEYGAIELVTCDSRSNYNLNDGEFYATI